MFQHGPTTRLQCHQSPVQSNVLIAAHNATHVPPEVPATHRVRPHIMTASCEGHANQHRRFPTDAASIQCSSGICCHVLGPLEHTAPHMKQALLAVAVDNADVQLRELAPGLRCAIGRLPAPAGRQQQERQNCRSGGCGRLCLRWPSLVYDRDHHQSATLPLSQAGCRKHTNIRHTAILQQILQQSVQWATAPACRTSYATTS